MILVIGDAMQDEYLYGESTRLSPEAAVPIVAVKRTEKRQGGAANVANNIESMGVPVIRIFGGGEPIRKLRVLAGKQHIARIDYDHPQEPILSDSTFIKALTLCDMVVAVDYGRGSLANIADLIAAAGQKPVLVDPKGHDYARYRGAALIKPNRDEMRELVGGWGLREELDRKASAFLAQSGIGALLLTLSEGGMTLYTSTGAQHQAAENSAPIDVSGAGEATLAAFAVATARGLSPMPYASRAAGLAIGRFGTVVLTKEEVFGTA